METAHQPLEMITRKPLNSAPKRHGAPVAEVQSQCPLQEGKTDVRGRYTQSGASP